MYFEAHLLVLGEENKFTSEVSSSPLDKQWTNTIRYLGSASHSVTTTPTYEQVQGHKMSHKT